VAPIDTPVFSETVVLETTSTVNIAIGDCPSNARITSPPIGALTNGAFTIFGTADSEDFGSYRIEAIGPQTGETWLSILSDEGQSAVVDGILASPNISNWLPGSYLIQLQLFDSAGEQTDICTIEIVLG
jgi:hypothetical protein